MTGYSVTSNEPTGAAMAIRAVNYELRIIQIVAGSQNADTQTMSLWRYETGTISGGGVAVSSSPLRQGAPAASAETRTGVAPATTGLLIQSFFISQGSQIELHPGYITYTKEGSTAQFQPPLTTTIAPGGTFVLRGLWADIFATIYFEENHLPGSS